MYDFHKIKQIGKEQEYKHDLFKRGKKFIRVIFKINSIGNCYPELKGKRTIYQSQNIQTDRIIDELILMDSVLDKVTVI